MTEDQDCSLSYSRYPNFELFWAAYPRKVAKLDAQKAWRQVKAEALTRPQFS